MTFARLHVAARRGRRRVAVLAVMLLLGGAVVVAHSAIGDHHIGGDAAMCLATLTVGAVAVAGLTRTHAQMLRAPLLALMPIMTTSGLAPTRSLTVRTRAGPAVLQVFLR